MPHRRHCSADCANPENRRFGVGFCGHPRPLSTPDGACGSAVDRPILYPLSFFTPKPMSSRVSIIATSPDAAGTLIQVLRRSPPCHVWSATSHGNLSHSLRQSSFSPVRIAQWNSLPISICSPVQITSIQNVAARASSGQQAPYFGRMRTLAGYAGPVSGQQVFAAVCPVIFDA